MVSAATDNCQLNVNRTVFRYSGIQCGSGPTLIVVAVLGLACCGWWLHAGHAEQESHLTMHDGKITALQRESDRILAKPERTKFVKLGSLVSDLAPQGIQVDLPHLLMSHRRPWQD